MNSLGRPSTILLLALALLSCGSWRSGRAASAPDTLAFEPSPPDTGLFEPVAPADASLDEEWLRAAWDDRLLDEPEEWGRRGERGRLDAHLDYNRVDPLRVGVGWQAQRPTTMRPRLGARLEYATGRERVLYAVQVEQPLAPRGMLAVGVTMGRRTEHNPLQQVSDVENSLALLFGRQDYRDYFEREGFGGYVSSRLGGVTTASVSLMSERDRSIPRFPGTRSWLHRQRTLRPNPPIEEDRARIAVVRLERWLPSSGRARAGFAHRVDFETAGRRLGGDQRYDRALADLRALIRTSPATAFALRAVGGSCLGGVLPPQNEFVIGGPDGLRAHATGAFRGNQVALMQVEYSVELWHVRRGVFEGGLHAIVFLDSGRAWNHPDHGWNVQDQRMDVDGGFGVGTAEDNLRVYFARNLRQPDSGFVVSARLQRPF